MEGREGIKKIFRGKVNILYQSFVGGGGPLGCSKLVFLSISIKDITHLKVGFGNLLNERNKQTFEEELNIFLF